MQRTKQLTVCLSNTPGALAGICRALANAQVNIEAISVVDAAEACLVRMVVSDPKGAVKALQGMRLQVIETPVRMVELPNRPGALAEWTQRLQSRNVNVDFVYGSAGCGKGKVVLIVDAHAG